jgi:hypothetical protein
MSAPLRPAEEIAHEMVTVQLDSVDLTWYGKLSDGSDEGAAILWPCDDREKAERNAERARRLIARLIEQRDAEHAAAERERPVACSWCESAPCECVPRDDESSDDEPEPETEQPRDLAERTWAGRVRDDGSVVIYAGNVPVAALGAAELHKLAMAASNQPRDLAGRIRALIDLHVTRWLEADGDDATILMVAIDRLKKARDLIQQGRSVAAIVAELRRGWRAWAPIVDRAADELEAIVRECGEAGR